MVAEPVDLSLPYEGSDYEVTDDTRSKGKEAYGRACSKYE